ncbi:hypothetical protein ACJX0J_034437, partial [Zea mays]
MYVLNSKARAVIIKSLLCDQWAVTENGAFFIATKVHGPVFSIIKVDINFWFYYNMNVQLKETKVIKPKALHIRISILFLLMVSDLLIGQLNKTFLHTLYHNTRDIV